MLLFFLSSLLFLSNSLSLDKLPARETVADDVKMGADDVMMHIQMVMRNQTGNSKSLIESLEKLDPATIASVVVLVEQLLASVAADLLALQQASELSISAYNDANGAHDAAVVEKVRLDEVILAHQASLAEQVIVVQSTLDTKNTASGAKINAQATLDAGSSRLNGEHSTLTQVLGLINGLAPVLATEWTRSNNVYKDMDCPNRGNYRDNLEGCKLRCVNEPDCTAFNMDNANTGCALRQCPVGKKAEAPYAGHGSYYPSSWDTLGNSLAEKCAGITADMTQANNIDLMVGENIQGVLDSTGVYCIFNAPNDPHHITAWKNVALDPSTCQPVFDGYCDSTPADLYLDTSGWTHHQGKYLHELFYILLNVVGCESNKG